MIKQILDLGTHGKLQISWFGDMSEDRFLNPTISFKVAEDISYAELLNRVIGNYEIKLEKHIDDELIIQIYTGFVNLQTLAIIDEKPVVTLGK